MAKNPFHVRISDETLEIFKKYFPNLNLPAQIAQMAWEFDQMKESRKLSPAIMEQLIAHGKKESEG